MSRQSTVQQLLQRLRCLDDDPNGKSTKDQTEQIMRRAGQHTLQIPRRGCVEEYSSQLQKLQHLSGVAKEERAPAREALLNVQAAEQWREAECLALRPHSMSRLKQLPELRQIISHTCLDAAHAAAGSMTQHLVEYAAQKFHQQRERKQEGAYGRGSTGSGDDSSPRLADYVAPEKLYALNHQQKDASLLAHVTPGLRLCLAAEVAVGMLCAGQQPPPDTPEHAAALQMFVVEAWKHQARKIASEAVASDFRKEDPSAARDAIFERLDDLCRSDWLQNAPAELRRKAEAYVQGFEELGLDEDDELISTVREVFMLGPAAAQHLTASYLSWLEALGFDSAAWQRRAARAAADAAARERLAHQAQTDARVYRMRLRLRDGGRVVQHAVFGEALAEMIDTLEERRLAVAEQQMLELDSEDELQLFYISRQQQQQQQGMAGDVTDPGANGIAASLAAAAAGGGGAEGGWDVAAAVSAADAALRQFALRCSALFSPLIAWYGGWLRQHDLLVRQSRVWWCSEARCKLAADGCRGMRPAPTSGAAAAAAAAAGVEKAAKGGKKASCGGSCDEEWPNGGYDFHVSCPLCQQEQQQEQQQQQQEEQQQSEAVPHTDPFLWRRLLWLLLGKLSPASQAFYAQYAAACPHCPDPEVWTMVRSSLLNSLWSSAAADVIEQQLSRPCHISVGANGERGDRMQLYARALNTSFEQGSHQTNTLLAQQLLLALSPLHAQLLPRPETAFLCPSSFPAAVGKALAGQLLSRPVLDSFQHSAAHLTMWHVHWHIGLRRYGSAQQQQQAGLKVKQQQRTGAAAAAACQGSGLYAELTAAELDQLYLDPDAKVAAVYYASRQLSGARNSALCSSSSSLRGLGLAEDTARAAEAALYAASGCPTTDFQEAAMQPPVPLEALLTPAVWSCRQQQLLDRANSCDACGKEAQLKHCARCCVALYCSFSCFHQDAERHAHICSQLAGAAKRYSPRTLSCKPSSAALQPPRCSSSSSSRVSSGDALVSPVRDCVEGEPWGLCSSAGAALDQLPVGVVPAELYMEQCRKTLNQILHAAPDTATNSLDAAGSSSSSSSRSSLYKNAWVDPWHGYGF
ncbi:hypothetical protein OEZ85_005822 [Tetradesmus obliquus]|uniref:MYND-type domain-containing protein n=1 Tax=Tetradesmus obliquus TaxID=3088 RepID=A0ABY8UEX9_TETOB|nr:hypothetical protein OEZ85_005822 [Tetradesmus obliquus]